MSSLVSIVIPTYNRSDDLARALRSVVAQTYSHWEAVVVDNHSTDDTSEVVRRFGDERITYATVTNNGVIAVSRNLGVARSSGEFVAFLDSDDYWTNDKLARALAWLGHGSDVVYHDMQVVSTARFGLGVRKFRTRQVARPVDRDLLVFGNTLPTSSVIVRRDLLLAVQGFNEDVDLIAGEDYDLWLRLGAVTQRFKRLPGTLGSLTRGSDNQFAAGRFLSVLSYIERKYISRLSSADRRLAYANWIDYAYARSRFKQREDAAAREGLTTVLRSSPSVACRIKALYMLIAIASRQTSRAHSC